jgi:hypothetical protein
MRDQAKEAAKQKNKRKAIVAPIDFIFIGIAFIGIGLVSFAVKGLIP